MIASSSGKIGPKAALSFLHIQRYFSKFKPSSSAFAPILIELRFDF